MSALPPEGKICSSCQKVPATTWVIKKNGRVKRKVPYCSLCARHASASGFTKKK